MLGRWLWRRVAPYVFAMVSQSIEASLRGFYNQLSASGMLQNTSRATAPEWNPQGIRESDLRH